jgi:hypothetical protein
MMIVSFHDRISGHASRTRVVDRFLAYAKGHKDVWIARKDEIAKYALATPNVTPLLKRDVAEVTGLAGATHE